MKNELKIYISKQTLLYFGYFLVCSILSLILLTPYYYISFIIVLGGALGYVILFYPFVGLIFYSFIFFIRPHEFVSVLVNTSIPVERIIALMLVASTIIKLKYKSQLALRLTKIDKSLFFYMGVISISVVTALWISEAYDTWIKLIRLFTVYLLITYLIDSEKQLKIFIMVFILSSLFHASAAMINYYNGIRIVTMGIERAYGLDLSYGAPNSLASTMVYTLPFIYYYVTKNNSIIVKALMVIISLVLVWCIILTGSRTGMAGVIFFFILTIWMGRAKIIKICVLISFLVILWSVMPEQYKERFISTADLSSETGAADSARGRLEGLQHGLEMLFDRPILGYGIGNFSIAMGTVYKNNWFKSHSLPGQLFGELGILGTIAFSLWLYYLFNNLWILRKKYHPDKKNNDLIYKTATGLIIQLLCLLFLGLGGHNLYRFNWFIIASLCVVLLKISKLEEKNQIVGKVP